MISDHFLKISKDFQNCSELKTNFSELFPKTTKDFPGETDDVLIIQQHIQVLLKDYVTIAMVIILVAMAMPISSNVKDKNSIFTASDEDIIF